MRICKRCLYPENHPLNITFDDEGICSGCRVHEEKDILDWKERSEKLESILDNYKNKSGNNYDCIIPVSGAAAANFFHFTEHSVIITKSVIPKENKIRIETHANYVDSSFDEFYRLNKKSEKKLTELLNIKIEKEII